MSYQYDIALQVPSGLTIALSTPNGKASKLNPDLVLHAQSGVYNFVIYPADGLSPSASSFTLGVSATGQIGSSVDQLSFGVSGVGASSSVGAEAVSVSLQSAGVFATGGVGLEVASVSFQLLGAEATGQTIDPPWFDGFQLVGLSSSGLAGILTGNTLVGVTTVAIAGSFSSVGEGVSIYELGVYATGAASNVSLGGSASWTGVGVSSTGIGGMVLGNVASLIGGVGALGGVYQFAFGTPAQLTGVAGSSGSGILSLSFGPSIAGIFATGYSGNLNVSLKELQAGIFGTGQVEVLGIGQNASTAISGVLGTGQVGSLPVSLFDRLTGLSAVSGFGQLGTLSSLTSVIGAGLSGNLSDSVIRSITGVNAASGIAQLAVLNQLSLISGLGQGQVAPLGIFRPLPALGVGGLGFPGNVQGQVGSILLGTSAGGGVGSFQFAESFGLGGVEGRLLFSPLYGMVVVVPYFVYSIPADEGSPKLVVPTLNPVIILESEPTIWRETK